MQQTEHNPLTYSKLATYEAQLLAELPDLYPDEGERGIVEEVLLPHFKEKLLEALAPLLEKTDSQQAISLVDLQAACKIVDGVLNSQKDLLDIEGLFGPVQKIITRIRQKVSESFKGSVIEKGRTLFAQIGITDAAGLIARPANWFNLNELSPGIKWYTLFRELLGEKMDSTQRKVKTQNLEAAAKILYGEVQKIPKMDESYFNNTKNIEHDLGAFAAALPCKINELDTFTMSPLKVTCANGEIVSGDTYIRRAAVAYKLAKTNREAGTYKLAALIKLKKMIELEVKTYPPMDEAYFANRENIYNDLSAFAKAVPTTLEKLSTTHFSGNKKVFCANSEEVLGHTYLCRAGVALKFADGHAGAASMSLKILTALKEKLDIKRKIYVKMSALYFQNPKTIRRDLQAYAEALGVQIKDLHTENLKSVRVVCQNGEEVRGGTYITRAAIALGLARNNKEADSKLKESVENLVRLAA